MITTCEPLLIWTLSRRGRELVTWDVAGLPDGAVADVRLENSSIWSGLMISADRDVLSTWAAGPDFTEPGAGVLVVPTTSRAEIKVTAGQTVVFLDGGYIELLP